MRASNLYLCAILLTHSLKASAANSIFETNIPAGVQIGMSYSALTKTRPKAKDAGLASNDGSQQFVEIVISGSERVAYWYRFRNEILGAVTKSVMAKKTPVEQVRESVEAIQAEIQSRFNFVQSDEIVRSTGIHSEILTAQHWKDNGGDLELYFVASNQEITLVFFNPKNFDKSDFFLGPKRLEDVRASKKSVQQILKGIKPESIQLEPVPLIDLLSSEPSVSLPQAKSDGTFADLKNGGAQLGQSGLTKGNEVKARAESGTKESSGMPVWSLFVTVAAILGVLLFLIRMRVFRRRF